MFEMVVCDDISASCPFSSFGTFFFFLAFPPLVVCLHRCDVLALTRFLYLSVSSHSITAAYCISKRPFTATRASFLSFSPASLPSFFPICLLFCPLHFFLKWHGDTSHCDRKLVMMVNCLNIVKYTNVK